MTAEETSGVSGYASAPTSGRSRPSSSTSADTRWPPTTRSVTLYAAYAMAPTATKFVRPPTSCATNWLASPYSNPRTAPGTPFHPSPYVPSAKSPSERIPHRPLTPWTEIAPTGSSMRSRASMKNTATHTSTPATPPINTADGAVTNAHGAVMATSPANVPFASLDGSGLPYFRHTYSIAVTPPAAPASIVFVAMTPMRRSEPASVDPALNPNHPKARMNVPTNAIGMLWPGIAFAVPSRLYLPRRGPRRIAVTNAITPPVMWTTDDPAKSTWPWPNPRFLPSMASQPPPQVQFA